MSLLDWSTRKVWGDVARLNAAVFGDKPAFVSAGRTLSFAAVNTRINRLNNALAGLGLAHGDRVAILSRNRPEFFEVYGVAKSGLVAVPLNWRLAARELLHPLRDSRPRVIVAESNFTPVIDALRPELAGVDHFIVLGAASAGWTAYEGLLAAAAADEPGVEPRPDDALCLTYSSGTTGIPKGAIITHRGALNNCRAMIQDLLKLTPDDVGLAAMPLFHVGGMWYHLFPSFASGGTTIMLPQFDPRAVLAAIQDQGVTQVHLVPTMIAALLDEPGVRSLDLGRLRTLYYAASSIPLVLLKRALEVFRHCGFIQSFGSTEAGSVTALLPEDHVAAMRDPGREGLLLSCGRPYGGASVEIRNASGAPAATGAIGDIAVRSDRTMAGYWQNPAATAQVMVDGWLYTGDLGYLDQEGYLYIVERKHDLIVTGGENVYPREVEDILYQDPKLAEVAVFAIPDPKWVERVAAAVVLKPGCTTTAEEIRQRAARSLASYKCPKTVFFVDSLPKNATGKILKKELRLRYAEWLASGAGS
jgi:acyl-CoA synthetase (AMP-forming)/AMP-acid ligase II